MFPNRLKVFALIVFLNFMTRIVESDRISFAIASEARNLKMRDFKGDPLVKQTTDKARSISIYKEERNDEVIFKSWKIDPDEDVVVLPSQEPGKRNTYVVLRKSDNGNRLYYITYAYVRDATSQDGKCIQVGDRHKCIEWDTFEDRNNKNWLDCRASVIVSCAYNNTLVGEPKKNMFIKQLMEQRSTPGNRKILPFKTTEDNYGYSTSEFYTDMEDWHKELAQLGRGLSGSTSEENDEESAAPHTENAAAPINEGQMAEPEKTTNLYTLVNTTKTLPSGETKTVQEFVPCESKDACAVIYRKTCNDHGHCYMKQDERESKDSKGHAKIYIQRWKTIKSKQGDSDKFTEEKIKHYDEMQVFWKDCGPDHDELNCTMVKATANDNMDNIKLYGVFKVEQPKEFGDTFVMEQVDQYKQLAYKDISNLFKNKCNKGKNCTMIHLAQWIDDDDDITTSSANGEYKLYSLIQRTVLKTDRQTGTQYRSEINKYEPTKTLTAKNLFTNICNNEHCSMEPVMEDGGYKVYKIVAVPRNTTLPNGVVVNSVSRFRAVPPNKSGNKYTKVCENGKTCVMRPLDPTEYVKFFREVVDFTKKPPRKYFKNNPLYRKVCPADKTDESECKTQGIAHVKDALNGPVFEIIPPKNKDEEAKTVQFDPAEIDQIYYQLCTSKICGMIHIAPESVKYFRLLKQKRIAKVGDAQHKEVIEPHFVPTKIFKKSCPVKTTCVMEHIPLLNISVQEEIQKVKGKLYYLIYSPKQTRWKGLTMVPNFEPLEEGALLNLFEETCPTCPMQHVDVLQEFQIYKKLNATVAPSGGTHKRVVSFEPIHLYKKSCTGTEDGSEGTCAMEPAVVTSEDLKKKTVLFITKVIGNKTLYGALDPESVDQLYRKYCNDGKCSLRPLRQDEPNVYFELMQRQKGKEEFKAILIYKRKCPYGKTCKMEEFIRERNHTKVKDTLYVRETAVQGRALGETPTVLSTYNAIPKEREDKIYERVCSEGTQKCSYVPILGGDVLHKKGPNEYVPIKVFRQTCDEAKKNCDMKAVNPSEETPIDSDLFYFEGYQTVGTTQLANKTLQTKNRLRYLSLPAKWYLKLYRKVCTETGCKTRQLFEKDGEVVSLNSERPIPENSPDEPLRFDRDNKTVNYHLEDVFKIICVKDCRMVPTSVKDDFQKITVYEQIGSSGGKDKYEPFTYKGLRLMYRKICFEDKCTLTRLFPETKGTIYTRGGRAGNLNPVFIYKKENECETKECPMNPITLLDNPRKIQIYRLDSEKFKDQTVGRPVQNDIVNSFIPILPEVNDGVYFRKICDDITGKCFLKDIFEDQNTLYQLITVLLDPENNPDDIMTEYQPIHAYKNVCNAGACTMVPTSPEDDFRFLPLFQLSIGKDSKTSGKMTKNYEPISEDIKFSLYRKICKDGVCFHIPLLEDEDSIYKQVTGPFKGGESKLSLTVDSTLDHNENEGYVLMSLNSCPQGELAHCKPKQLSAKNPIPEIAFERIVTKDVGGGRKAKTYKKLIHFKHSQYYRLHKKVCIGNHCRMIPLKHQTVYRRLPSKTGEKKFVPANLFTKECSKDSSHCNMRPLMNLDKINLAKLHELVEVNVKNKSNPVSIYEPIGADDAFNYFKKRNCSNSESKKCRMGRLIPEEIFVGRTFKVIKEGLDGNKQVDTELDLTPIYLFKRACPRGQKGVPKTKCPMDLFRAEDTPDDEGHYHLARLTLEKNTTRLSNGTAIIKSVRKYFPVAPEISSLLHRMVCTDPAKTICSAKPIFDSTFYLWKNSTRKRKTQQGQKVMRRRRRREATGTGDEIVTEEFIPINLVLETCSGSRCSAKPLSGEETPKMPVKIFIQDKVNIRTISPTGKDEEDTQITNRVLTSELRNHTYIKVCPSPDVPCFMKPFRLSKLGAALDEYEEKNGRSPAVPEDTGDDVDTNTHAPLETKIENQITEHPTPPNIPQVDEVTSQEPRFQEVISTPETDVQVVPEVTDDPQKEIDELFETEEPTTNVPSVVTEAVTLPVDIIRNESSEAVTPYSGPYYTLGGFLEIDIGLPQTTTPKSSVPEKPETLPPVKVTIPAPVKITTPEALRITTLEPVNLGTPDPLGIGPVQPEKIVTLEPKLIVTTPKIVEPDLNVINATKAPAPVINDTNQPGDDDQVEKIYVNDEYKIPEITTTTVKGKPEPPPVTEKIPETTGHPTTIHRDTNEELLLKPTPSDKEIVVDRFTGGDSLPSEEEATTKRITKPVNSSTSQNETKPLIPPGELESSPNPLTPGLGEITSPNPFAPPDDLNKPEIPGETKPSTVPPLPEKPTTEEALVEGPLEPTTVTYSDDVPPNDFEEYPHGTDGDVMMPDETTEEPQIDARRPKTGDNEPGKYPDASDEYDDMDDLPEPKSIGDPEGPFTSIINSGDPNCGSMTILETPIGGQRIVLKTKDPLVENGLNQVVGFIIATKDNKVLHFNFPWDPNQIKRGKRSSDAMIKHLRLVYTSKDKQKYLFEFMGIPDENVENAGKKFKVYSEQGELILSVPHPSVNKPVDAKFNLKRLAVSRSLTNFRYSRQRNGVDDFDYTQPLSVDISPVPPPNQNDKRYKITFKTPDGLHVTFNGKKKPTGPVIIRSIHFETCRTKNISVRLPLEEVHEDPDNEAWLVLSYTNREALQEIKFPGVTKPKGGKLNNRSSFQTPKGTVIFDPACDELSNTKIHLLLHNGEKYVFEVPALNSNFLETKHLGRYLEGEMKSRKKKTAQLPLAFPTSEGKKVVFVTQPPKNPEDPFKVISVELESPKGEMLTIRLPGPHWKNDENLHLSYRTPSAPDPGLLINFPMIQYNGETELNIQTRQGKIEMMFDQGTYEPNLVLRFGGVNYTIPDLSLEVSPVDPHSESGAIASGMKIMPINEIGIETPDNRKILFRTEDHSYQKIFRVFEMKLETEAHEFVLKFPAKSVAKNVKYLELEYATPGAPEPMILQIPGIPFDKNKMRPGKSISILTSRSKLVFDFPRLKDWTRDSIRIIYSLANSTKSFTFDCPFLNLAGLPKPKKNSAVVGRRGISMHTVEGRSVTVEVEGDPEETLNLEKPLVVTALHFNVDQGQNTTFYLMDKKHSPGRKFMELLYIQPGEKPMTLSLTGIPPIEIDINSDSETTFKIKAEQGIIIVDIPRPMDESRSGIRFDLLLLNEDRKSYEVNGLILKPTDGKVDLSNFKYSIKTRNVFKCREGKRVEFLTIGEPGTGKPLRILEATFDVPKLGKMTFQITQPTVPGTEHPKWLQLIYTGKDGTQLVFEIPGIPNETSEGDGRPRKITFNSIVPNQGVATLTVPGSHSNPVDVYRVDFVVVGNQHRDIHDKSRFELKDFSFDKTIKKFNIMSNFGRAFTSIDGSDVVEEHPEGTSKNLFYHPGWKLQYQHVEPNVTLVHEDDIFYGLGNCPYQQVTISELMKAKSPSKLIRFYLTVLRTECLDDKQKYIRSLVRSKYLEMSGKYLRVPPRAKILKKPKLNHEEAQKLSSAFEMEVVTSIFNEEMAIPDKYPLNPIGSRISRSASFLTNLAMSFITKSRANCRAHFIRLSRHLLTTLKTAFMKLVQDKVALEDCKECKGDKKINHCDRLQLMGLMQFVIHGMGPVELGVMDTWTAFRHFFKVNAAAIESRLK